MKIGENIWAIVKPDGTIAGDGECLCLYSSYEMASDELEHSGAYLKELNESNLVIASVHLVTRKD